MIALDVRSHLAAPVRTVRRHPRLPARTFAFELTVPGKPGAHTFPSEAAAWAWAAVHLAGEPLVVGRPLRASV